MFPCWCLLPQEPLTHSHLRLTSLRLQLCCSVGSMSQGWKSSLASCPSNTACHPPCHTTHRCSHYYSPLPVKSTMSVGSCENQWCHPPCHTRHSCTHYCHPLSVKGSGCPCTLNRGRLLFFRGGLSGLPHPFGQAQKAEPYCWWRS